MKQLLCILALALASNAALAATTLKVSVHGMVCAFCAQGIEKRLSKLPAVGAIFVDLKRGIVAVEARPGQTLDPKKVEAEIVEAGYAVAKLEVLAQSLAEVKAGP